MATKKNLKGLSLDNKPIDQIQDTYPFGKNGIQHDVKGAIINEPGFLVSSAVIPYTTIGIIETDTFPVVFSTDGTNSAIGFYNPTTDVYAPIIDDSAESWKMGFRLDKYITGQFQKNNKDEYIVAWTDKWNEPRIINCNNPQITKTEDLLLFLRSEVPEMEVTAESGGDLAVGSYFVSVKYIKADGSETPFLITSNAVVVSTADANEFSDKALRIELADVDTTFQYVVIAVISKVKGVVSAVQLDPIPSAATMSVVYTGNNRTTAISIDEILVKPAVYTRVGTMGQLNDALYIADLEQAPDIDYQPYANMVQVRVQSDLIDLSNKPADLLSGNKKGMMHEDVYALYIRLRYTDGRRSRAFTIPGPAPQSGDQNVITIGGITAKTFQLIDTVRGANPADKTVTPGVWLNADETYPDHESFDSTTLGGENLRGAAVRHHRMPSLRYCKTTFYAGDPQYGKSKLDLLGLQVSNVQFPAEHADIIDGYEILFAKRTLGNAMVLGQSLTLLASQDLKLINQGVNTNLVSTGGNWQSLSERSNTKSDWNNAANEILKPKTSRVRFHPFDMLFNKPSIPGSNTYLSFQYKTRVNNIGNTTVSWGVDENIARKDRSITDGIATAFAIDYMGNNAITPTVITGADRIRSITGSSYAPNNVNGGEWNNTQLETAVALELSSAIPSINLASNKVATGAYETNKNTPMGKLDKAEYVQFEESIVANLMVLRDNVYNTFYSQTIVSTGKFFKKEVVNTPTIFAGDTFIGDYSFHTYGWTSSVNASGEKDPDRAGVKVVRRVAVESVSNINARYEIAGNIYSKWWPQTGLTFGNGYSDYIMQFQRSIDPNQFGYSRDLNTLNDFDVVLAFNPFEEQINKFPYRIARGGQYKREGLNRSWRTFLPLDYYEAQKNMGKIINLEGMDDRLLIHHENALFLTQDKTKLESDIISITLGSGDIFQFQPQEAISSKLGYAGTQHDLACVKTPLGYVFADAKRGQVFLYKGKLQLLNNGLNTFFRQWLTVTDNNPFVGNGITIGYDPKYNRILLTVKNKTLTVGTNNFVPGYEETEEFYDQLVADTSIVYKDGRYQRFLGINETIYSCPALPVPTIGDYEFSIPENSAFGADVGDTTGTGGTGALTYSIIAGNTGGAFSINSVTGLIEVSNTSMLDHELYPTFTLTIRVTDINGQADTGTVVITVTDVVEGPSLGDYVITIPEDTAVATNILTVAGTSPEGLPLTYSFVGSVTDFSISSGGAITVALPLDAVLKPEYILTVQATDGTNTDTGTVTIYVTKVSDAPIGVDQTVTILDSHIQGSLVLQVTPATNPNVEEDINSLDYTLQSESTAGAFTIQLDDPDAADFLTLKLGASTVLDPAVEDTYVMTIRATNSIGQYDDFTVTVTVLYDPDDLVCEPVAFSCSTVREYTNVAKTEAFQKTGCGAGTTGSWVPYTVPAGTYSASSQVAADALAQADIDANGQTNANTVGVCLESTTISILVVDLYNDNSLDVCAYIDTPGVAASGDIALRGTNFVLSTDDAAGAYILASDAITDGALKQRFQFNIGKLIAEYPDDTAVPEFVFKIRGRSNVAKTITGVYAKKFPTQSMVMLGSAGSYIPSVTPSLGPATTAYTTHIGGGGDGTVGLGIGDVFLIFTYNRALNMVFVTTF